MAGASYMRPSFLSGSWTPSAQGRTDRPDYITALNECLHAVVTETGSWVRRSGTAFAQTTRSGAQGKLFKFDFQQQNPYVIELTDAHMRFWSGRTLATTNDSV